MRGITPVLRGVLPSRCTHEGILSCQAKLASQDVRQTGSGPGQRGVGVWRGHGRQFGSSGRVVSWVGIAFLTWMVVAFDAEKLGG